MMTDLIDKIDFGDNNPEWYKHRFKEILAACLDPQFKFNRSFINSYIVKLINPLIDSNTLFIGKCFNMLQKLQSQGAISNELKFFYIGRNMKRLNALSELMQTEKRIIGYEDLRGFLDNEIYIPTYDAQYQCLVIAQNLTLEQQELMDAKAQIEKFYAMIINNYK